MKVTCPNCGREMDLVTLRHDENNLEGFYTYDLVCQASFDIDESIILNQMFIGDIPKMADFKILSKEEFLSSYDYLTEDEYDATELYFNWLMRDDSEP